MSVTLSRADPPAEPPTWSGTALVVRAGTVVEELSSGPAGEPGGAPCSPGLRFEAGSISKLVLSTAVLALSERGLLGLDEPVARHLDDLPAAWAGITPRHLIGQTSGLGHWGDLPGLLPAFVDDPPGRGPLLDLVRATPPVSPPGLRWRYSGPGFLVAALVVEAVTGSAYGDAADELVLRPAGLRSTTSGRHPATTDGIALGHRSGEVLAPVAGFTDLPGTGDLWTTVADLVTLNRALRTGVLLRPETAERLWTPAAQVPAGVGGGPVVTEAYGLGTFLGRVKGRPARIHPGDNPGYQSLLAHLPDDDLDVVVLGNAEAPCVDDALRALRSF